MRWLFMLAALAGCSFSLSGPDAHRTARQVPRCDTGKGLVLTDGLIATTAGIAATSLALDNQAIAIVPAVIGAVFIGALIHGNSVVDECRADNEKYVAELDAAKPPGTAAQLSSPQEPPAELDHQLVAPTQPPRPAATLEMRRPAESSSLPSETWAQFWKEVR